MKKLIFLLLAFVVCSNFNSVNLKAQNITINENESFVIDIDAEVRGKVDGIGFHLEFDSTKIAYLGASSQFDIVADQLLNPGYLIIGLKQLNNSAFNSSFVAVQLEFMTLPIDSTETSTLLFKEVKAKLNGRNIIADSEDSIINIEFENKIYLRIRKVD